MHSYQPSKPTGFRFASQALEPKQSQYATQQQLPPNSNTNFSNVKHSPNPNGFPPPRVTKPQARWQGTPQSVQSQEPRQQVYQSWEETPQSVQSESPEPQQQVFKFQSWQETPHSVQSPEPRQQVFQSWSGQEHYPQHHEAGTPTCPIPVPQQSSSSARATLRSEPHWDPMDCSTMATNGHNDTMQSYPPTPASTRESLPSQHSGHTYDGTDQTTFGVSTSTSNHSLGVQAHYPQHHKPGTPTSPSPAPQQSPLAARASRSKPYSNPMDYNTVAAIEHNNTMQNYPPTPAFTPESLPGHTYDSTDPATVASNRNLRSNIPQDIQQLEAPQIRQSPRDQEVVAHDSNLNTAFQQFEIETPATNPIANHDPSSLELQAVSQGLIQALEASDQATAHLRVCKNPNLNCTGKQTLQISGFEFIRNTGTHEFRKEPNSKASRNAEELKNSICNCCGYTPSKGLYKCSDKAFFQRIQWFKEMLKCSNPSCGQKTEGRTFAAPQKDCETRVCGWCHDFSPKCKHLCQEPEGVDGLGDENGERGSERKQMFRCQKSKVSIQ